MGVNSGAGAAVASGANYQARVASYVLATAICRAELNSLCDGPVATIGFETAESIDDINLRLADDRLVYLQAKARIDYSLSPTGELMSVLQQFESQESKGSKASDSFVLVTSSRSSKKIVYDLRAALEAFRISPEREFLRDQPKALTEIVRDLRAALCEAQTAAGRVSSLSIADRIIRKSRVVALDIETGDPLEHAAVLLLQSQKFAAPTAVWGKLIADCVEHARARHTVKVKEAETKYEQYRVVDGGLTPEASDDLMPMEFGTFDFPVGKEVVLCHIPEDMPPFSPGIAIMEFYRFDEDCAERIQFTDDAVILAGNRRIPLLRRAATYTGLSRLIEATPDLAAGAEVTMYTMNVTEDLESGLCAEVHRERLRKAALNNPHKGRCVHCGRPVSEKEPCLIESGTMMEPVVGLCHAGCLAASDRLIGKADIDFFGDYPELVNFDVNAWFRAMHGGQIAIGNAKSITGGRTPHLAWGGGDASLREGQYVLEMCLQGGGSEICTLRNGVHRFSKMEADKFASRITESLKTAQDASDPICYTDQSKGFGPRSFLLEQFGGSERIIPVESARVRKYDERFAIRFSRPGHWYAPLLYLRDIETDEPIAVLNTVLLISDPLKLRNFLENWHEARIETPDYETVSILTDAEFDSFMRWVEDRNWRAVIDPLISPKDGSLVSGIPISSFEAMARDREHQDE